MNFGGFLPNTHNGPWSPTTPWFCNLGQPSSQPFMSADTSIQPFSGEIGPSTMSIDDWVYVDAVDRGWFDTGGLYDYSGAQSRPDDIPKT